ncbi:hypothetical protein TCAL_11373 [Tigriopus californicus]|uniref:M-phase phosphoprotein 6 n=1 Tax=Tigriopus californicus TaxID=6832 RepID=A0A553NXW5_TIGCA|nr:M-phase phosphoprotein 6-like [Tigriopus californicus]TRY70273.1 hypothetical protein TCAL_11373 [Tigriopus californicus]|eukprot:TCALIF_11373-PA protein Name:"Protein of unknown function" AED:0.00 eAED:0.00 QI:377/1/1/1/1/1/3/51/165
MASIVTDETARSQSDMAQKKMLSKNLLQMKFMKRTREKQIEADEQDERHRLFQGVVSDAMRIQGDRFILEPSYASLFRLSPGRMAFKDMNPELSAELASQVQSEDTPDPNETEVDDETMASQLAPPIVGGKRNFRYVGQPPPTPTPTDSKSREHNSQRSRKRERK